MSWWIKIVIVVGLVSLMAACAGTGANTSARSVAKTDNDLASERAEARWAAMIEKDLDRAHTFLSPGSRATHPLKIFKGKIRPLNWRSAKALSARCEADTCHVSIRLTVEDQRLGGEVTTVFEEVWLRDSGQWWLLFN
jgi:hypothetical protein